MPDFVSVAEFRALEKIIKEQALIIDAQSREIERLRKRCEELEKRLRMYENPPTPTSRPTEPEKRGAPEGHVGVTRERPTPDRIVHLKSKRCIKCKSRKIRKLKEHRKLVEDILIVRANTEFRWWEYICKKCGKHWTTSSPELPKEGKGNFGPNITSLWTTLHYQGTVPFKRLAEISRDCFKTDISPGGIHNVVYRAVDAFKPYLGRIAGRIKKSKYAGSDETTYSFNGRKYWLWNISTKKDVLVLLRKSRNSKVLEEVFGELFDGILNSDCHSLYNKYKARKYQKCWAHVIRSAKEVSENNEKGKELYKILKRMHKYIKKTKENEEENTPKVKRWICRQKKEISSWLDKNYESRAVKNVVLAWLNTRTSGSPASGIRLSNPRTTSGRGK